MRFGVMFLLLHVSDAAFSQMAGSTIQLTGTFPTYSKKFCSTLSLYTNATSGLNLESVSAVIYKEQKFLIKELGVFYATVAKQIPGGAAGIAIQHSGLNTFRQTKFSVFYSKPLGKVDLAAKFNYILSSVEGYRPIGVITCTIAGVFHFNDQFHSGFQLEHLNSIFSNKKQRAPQADYRFGFGYDVSGRFHISMECTKQASSVNVNAGFIYQLHAKCSLLLEMGTFTPVPAFGAQYSLSPWSIGVKTSYHPHLGVTPALWILFQKRKAE